MKRSQMIEKLQSSISDITDGVLTLPFAAADELLHRIERHMHPYREVPPLVILDDWEPEIEDDES